MTDVVSAPCRGNTRILRKAGGAAITAGVTGLLLCMQGWGDVLSQAAPSVSESEMLAVRAALLTGSGVFSLTNEAELLAVLVSPSPASLQAPLPSLNRRARNGRTLPDFYNEPRAPGVDAENVVVAGLLCQNATEYRTALWLQQAIPLLVKLESVEFVAALERRGRRIPPSRFDILVSIGLSSSKRDGLSSGFWQKSAPAWRKMVSSKNPVYRLWALQQVRFFESDERRSLMHYRDALGEVNSIFRFIAIDGLERLGGTNAQKELQRFVERSPTPDDRTLEESIDTAAAAKAALARMRGRR